MAALIEDATHCISCGNELSYSEEEIGVGHCTQCLEEACDYYWKTEREEYTKK